MCWCLLASQLFFWDWVRHETFQHVLHCPVSFPFPSSVSPFHLAEPWHCACLLLGGRMDLLLPPTLPFNTWNTKLNKHPRTGCNSCNIGHFHFCSIMYSVKTSGGMTFLWIINMCTYVAFFSLVSAYVQAKNKRCATVKGCIYIYILSLCILNSETDLYSSSNGSKWGSHWIFCITQKQKDGRRALNPTVSQTLWCEHQK